MDARKLIHFNLPNLAMEAKLQWQNLSFILWTHRWNDVMEFNGYSSAALWCNMLNQSQYSTTRPFPYFAFIQNSFSICKVSPSFIEVFWWYITRVLWSEFGPSSSLQRKVYNPCLQGVALTSFSIDDILCSI